MRSEEFISLISQLAKDNEKFETLRNGIPLGVDSVGNVVTARREERSLAYRHICVTGNKRGVFIRRTLVTLSCLYDKSDVCFLVLSPKTEYGELLRLKSMEVTVPYVRLKSDLERAKETIKELLRMHAMERGVPKLVLVLDGLEELPDCNEEGDFAEYREFLELLSRRSDVEIISGSDLTKSIFNSYPGAFVGVGNCLVTTDEDGRGDVTYVGDDASLSKPTPILFPDAPSVLETILFLNSLPKEY